ncbi:MAG: hypothetical protein QOE82_104 [Thermoanaerobaculia bacterium]|jgi:glycosyltransferase involved in cell wall biosynthesis|nr:hypothetical protein [Thermoanaerobaculia bacterium]
MTPPLTVLMSVHNGEAYLREAIDSILCQTFRDFELLVIDDASTDGTASILASYADPRLRVVRNESNRGLTASLNIGLRLARGELIARHDADDRSHPSRFALQIDFLNANPNVAVLGSAYRNFTGDGGRPTRIHPVCTTMLGIRWQLLFGSPLAHSSVMFRRSVILDELGGYDETFAASQDFDLWSRASRKHVLANLREPLVELRVHPASISSRRTLANLEMVRSVLRSNLVETLGEGDYERWLDFWLTVNNPAAYGTILNPRSAKSDLRLLDRRFVALYPDAAGDAEIAAIFGAMLAQVACSMARQDRAAAIDMYLSAIRRNAFAAVTLLPRFSAKLALGPLPLRRPRFFPGGQSL